MKTKRLIALLLAVVMAAAMLAGCGESSKKQDDKIAISMYMWDRSMLKGLSPWLEKKFPDIEFTFIQSFNTMEYYKDLLARGEEIPDIITCRRFSLNDAAPLADHLMDLSQTEVAGTFYSSYLEVNRETNGAIRWLPMCAEVDCTMANKDLFDQYGIPLPTNYAEFVAAIDAFEAVGIKGYQTDWDYDYTCLETMQGCAIPELMSLEGTQWRMAYESETEEEQVGLDDVVWPKVFEKYEQFLKDVRFEQGDEELRFSATMDPYYQGKTAMVRNTAALADNITQERGINSVILPYFGETSEDNWLLTYPMCQLAVSKTVERDEAKRKAVLEVLSAIFSEEGQKQVAYGTSVLSYNKEVNITSSPALEYVQDCIDSNHLYMRLASTEVFAVSQDVGHKMMTGEYDAKAGYDAFNAQITNFKDPDAVEVMFTQETAYSNDFTDHGSAAASSLMNTIRSSMEADMAIGFSPTVSTSIYAGDYTLQQAKWVLTARNSVYQGEYTGEEVWRFMDWLVNVKEDGSNPIHHRNLMPVTSGLEYTVTEYERGKFRLEKVTVNGEPLDENATYNLMLVGADTFLEHETFCNCPMPADLKEKRQAYLVDDFSSQECMQEALEKTRQFLEPTEYVTILQGK
ncbi:extracellular solute-binding protein [Oscillibacter valericigenes]|uniref:5'-nucleotidase C-terminal domain-containing protein n=1 Tax=Oscillibacter valericigenes TaxID=351091 RepID=UPI001F462447|nr:5'-nucleotidase C-terminal domain-containing protein [Oscillibacter valericigenes]MCF2665211.1 extracellular solute-binding protein [Oscillibacter valericigenes]